MTKIQSKSQTCIAALKHKGKIYMAADRRVSWDMSQAQKSPVPKVIKRDGVILAGTGSSAILQLITNCLDIPVKETDIKTYMYYYFTAKVRKLLSNQGFVTEHKLFYIPEDLETSFIVAIKGTLWTMDLSHSIVGASHILIEQTNVPYADGCGGALAWGSLLTTEELKMSPKERLTIALKVAAQVSPGCDDNIDIEHE